MHITARSFENQQAILNFNDSGLSILEISHRSKDFVAVMDEAILALNY
jgi:phosphoserine aminotransferase